MQHLLLIVSLLGYALAGPTPSYTTHKKGGGIDVRREGTGPGKFGQGVGSLKLEGTDTLGTRTGLKPGEKGTIPTGQRTQLGSVEVPKQGYGLPLKPIKCGRNQVRNKDGVCVEAQVSESVFIFDTPIIDVGKPATQRPIVTPKPKLKYNYIFVRVSQGAGGASKHPDPIIIPPAQQKTLVYVLKETPEQKVIQVPEFPAHSPEVVYVDYKDGDKTQFPGGLTLEEILSQTGTPGHTVDSLLSGTGKPTGPGTEGETGYLYEAPAGTDGSGEGSGEDPAALYGAPAQRRVRKKAT